MKTKKILLSLSILALAVPSLASCDKKRGEWEITEEATAYLDGVVTFNDVTNTYTYSIFDSYPYFNKDIKIEKVVCFNLTKLAEDPKSEDEKSFTIDLVKQYEIKTSNLVVSPSLNELSFTFEGNENDLFGCVVSREATKDKVLIVSNTQESYASMMHKVELADFENKYLAYKAPVWNSDNTKLLLEDYFGEITSEKILKKDTKLAPGVGKALEIVAKVITFVYKQYKESTTPSIEDVYNKLFKIDDHISELAVGISKNQDLMLTTFGKLITEQEKSQIEIIKNRFYSINENYDNKFNEISSLFGLFLSEKFKDFISASRQIIVYYNDQGVLSPVADTGFTAYEVNVSNWDNAKAFLSSHGNVPQVGFIDSVKNDISKAAQNVTAPVKTNVFVSDLLSAVENKFLNDYFSSNEGKEKALDLRMLVINYANQISEIIAQTYVTQATLMYNFACEGNIFIREAFTGLLFKLDKFATLATMANDIAEIGNIAEIGQAYMKARDTIVSKYNVEMGRADNYSYVAGTTVTGKVIDVVVTAKAPDRSTFTASVEYVNKYVDKDGKTQSTVLDHNYAINNMFRGDVLQRVALRWNALTKVNEGKDKQLMDNDQFATYLCAAKVFKVDEIDDIKEMNKRIFMTGFDNMYTGFEMSSESDTNIDMKIIDRRGSGDTFKGETVVKYGVKNAGDSEKHWSGRKFLCQTFDASTGADLGQKLIGAYARYKTNGWKIGHAFGRNYSMVDNLSNHTYLAIFKD